MKKKKLALLTGVLALATSASVYAGTSYTSYSTTVGDTNGSGYTGYDQTKSTSGANGYIKSTSVGGDYVVDVRMLDAQGNGGDWDRNIDDGTNSALDGHVNHIKDDKMRLQFSNDWNTPVDVQVTGSWKSDN
ncbi:hypothetical protein M3196_15085 [Fictibacillus nanhaiensis]|uniref:hypothetical protein n=1 Tax=Fictibacillus nanhaiensis TaxID=742169 RepID=UPI00203C658D|nr:hypothetical protein [Fictibacillus nanhaiensis]MCM3732977.1 hypothetical protein [Fictibacillus nanhaiensis]